MMGLILQLKRLSPEQIGDLRHYFRNSPTTTLLLNFFLATKKDSYNIHDGVKFVYGAAATDPKYATFENRFYKLRKKIEDYLNTNSTYVNSVFSTDENALMEAKTLLASSKFIEALSILEDVDRNCRDKNLFEIWPEVIDSLLQAKQALNKLDDNDILHKKFTKSLSLYGDLMEAKNLTRRIYEVNYKQGAGAAEPLFLRLAKLDQKNRDYPRFKLIYNFVAGYYKVGSGDSVYHNKTNVTNRHIGAAKKIMRQFPEMPVIQHTATGQMVQRYRLTELQAMVYYNALRFKDAAKEIGHLYAQIMQQQTVKSQMKSEILFTNVMHMQVAAKQYKEALQTAKDYLSFLLSNNHYEKKSYAYAEIANIHVTMFPQSSTHNASFLLQQVNDYISQKSKVDKGSISWHGQVLKCKLLVTQHKFEDALRTIELVDLSLLTDRVQSIICMKELIKCALENTGVNRQTKMHELKLKSHKMKLQAETPGDFLSWRWIEDIAGYFQHK